MRKILAILLLFTAAVMGQDITIVAPPGKILPNQWEPIVFRGIAPEELPLTSIQVTPSDGAAVMLMQSIAGDNVIWFRSAKPGQSYKLEIGMNRWRLDLDNTLTVWKRSKVPADLVGRLEKLVDDASKQYPVKVGSALLEVAGTLPPPVVVDPDVPNPPPVVVSGKRKVFIVHETGSQSWRQGAAITSLRDGTNGQYLATKGHRLWVLDKDAKDENNNPSPLLKPVLEHLTKNNIPLPAVVIEDFSSGAILYAGKAPDPPNADKIVELIKQNGG